MIIHGTWGSRSDFAFEDSLFCRALKAEVFQPLEFVRFKWSGKNSELERVHAADDLIELIARISLRDDPIYILAHSHGGNVALEALRNTEVANRVKGIITMGTPFLRTELRQWVLLLESPLGFIFLLGVSLAIALTSVLSIVASSIGMIDMAFGIIGIFSLIFIIVIGVKSNDGNYISYISRNVKDYAASLNKRIPNSTPDLPILAITSKGDEAIWWLQSVFLVSNLPMALVGASIQILAYSLLVAFPFIWAGLGIGLLFEYTDLLNGALVFVILWLGACLTVVSLVLVVFPMTKIILHFAGPGKTRSIWEGLLTKTVATRLPSFRGQHTEHVNAPLRELFGGLWHSKYMRSGQTVDQIAVAINRWDNTPPHMGKSKIRGAQE